MGAEITKPISPKMREVLKFLSGRPEARLSVHYNGDCMTYVAGRMVNRNGSESSSFSIPKRITLSTFRALDRRGLLEFDRRRECGGIMGYLPNGSHGIVIPSYDMDYRISPKARSLIANPKENQ